MTPDCVVFPLFREVPLTRKKHLLACVNFCEQKARLLFTSNTHSNEVPSDAGS